MRRKHLQCHFFPVGRKCYGNPLTVIFRDRLEATKSVIILFPSIRVFEL